MSIQNSCSILSGILTIIFCLVIAIVCGVFLSETVNKQSDILCVMPNPNDIIYSSECILITTQNDMGIESKNILINIKSCPIKGYLSTPYINQTEEWVGERKCWYYGEETDCHDIGNGIYYQDNFPVLFVQPDMVKEREGYYECLAKLEHLNIVFVFLIFWLASSILAILITTILVVIWGIKDQRAKYYQV